ncbi:MAG TPA: gliding motility protein GldM [Bacteroidetes bacterium]|nr:gliding motility protein GldM [Bacteroidota bacterium]
MAHGKETPRQKMIGMMYLVLTALLALNVSKEAVEAFKLVDEGLTKTTANFVAKNELIYQDFAEKAVSNPVKAGPWKRRADEVKQRADELINYIQDLKLEIITKAEGKDSEAIAGGQIHTREIKKIDENNVPSEVMIGADQNGKAYDLKAMIVDFREFIMNDIVAVEAVNIRESIANSLNTDDYTEKDGSRVSWEIHNFHTLPLVAVITILSKIQVDIRNAEAETLNYLYNQIEAGSFKFNKLVPTVIPNSNYILRGNEYRAEVFIAATDTTQKPRIMVGNYDSTVTADGVVTYQMVGDYTELPIDKNGRGVYSIKPESLGSRRWGGLIRLQAPDGSMVDYPFRSSYQVSEASLVVSPTKMNVLYSGLDNPVDISVPGVAEDKIRVSLSRGTIRKISGSSYIIRPGRAGKPDVIVNVIADVDGVQRRMPPKPFRVKNVPDPVAQVAGRERGDISKAELMAQAGIFAVMKDFDFELSFRITGFKISINDRGYTVEEESNSNRITEAQRQLLDRLRRGDQVVFQDIKAVGPDGNTRPLPPVVLKVN